MRVTIISVRIKRCIRVMRCGGCCVFIDSLFCKHGRGLLATAKLNKATSNETYMYERRENVEVNFGECSAFEDSGG